MANVYDGRDDRSGDRFVARLQFDLIFVATFALCVAAALLTLLMPWTWPRRRGSEDKRWFIGRAWDEAGTLTELAFMG
jgi:hypothetical protein